MVFVEVPPQFWHPPAAIVEETRWDSPVNIENRDYLQVEKDAWAPAGSSATSRSQ